MITHPRRLFACAVVFVLALTGVAVAQAAFGEGSASLCVRLRSQTFALCGGVFEESSRRRNRWKSWAVHQGITLCKLVIRVCLI